MKWNEIYIVNVVNIDNLVYISRKVHLHFVLHTAYSHTRITEFGGKYFPNRSSLFVFILFTQMVACDTPSFINQPLNWWLTLWLVLAMPTSPSTENLDISIARWTKSEWMKIIKMNDFWQLYRIPSRNVSPYGYITHIASHMADHTYTIHYS